MLCQSQTKRTQKNLSSEKKQIKKELNIGQPLEFDKEETHSFNEWLKLSQAKPNPKTKRVKINFKKSKSH